MASLRATSSKDDDDDELFGNGSKAKLSFQKFPVAAFWQTNACNAELPTENENIAKLKFSLD